MPVVESKVKDGTLTLGTTPVDFSCQVTNIRINSAYSDDGDALEVLCGDTVPPGRKLDSRSLAGTFVQDWTAPEATQLTDYLYENDLMVVDFEYVPNVAGPTLTGQVRVEVPGETYGGDVATRLTSDFEWFIIGDLVRTPPVAAFESLTVDQLRERAADRGLATTGTKAELIERLTAPSVPVPA